MTARRRRPTALRPIGYPDVFATSGETGCIALEHPDEAGNFLGLDSEGVETPFHVSMVRSITAPDITYH